MILLKISGAIPMNPDKTKFLLRILARIYSAVVFICCVYIIFESVLFVVVNIEKMEALINGLWIKSSLFMTDLQLIGLFRKQFELKELMHCSPLVVTGKIGGILKGCMKRAMRLCHLIIWSYMFISIAVSILFEFRYKQKYKI